MVREHLWESVLTLVATNLLGWFNCLADCASHRSHHRVRPVYYFRIASEIDPDCR